MKFPTVYPGCFIYATFLNGDQHEKKIIRLNESQAVVINDIGWQFPFEPIEFTDEVLTRLGFKRGKEIVGGGMADTVKWVLDKNFQVFMVDQCMVQGYCCFAYWNNEKTRKHFVKLPYVHDLQKLYFHLTGLEWPILL